MNNNLLIIGAGEFGQFVKEIAIEMNKFEEISFLDDNSLLAIDKISNYKNYTNYYTNAIVAIGNPNVRLQLLNELEEAGYIVPIIVSSKAFVSKSSIIQNGTIIEPNATIQSNTVICKGCIISSNACVRHNSYVEEGCHIDCNSVVKSHSRVITKTKIECGEIYV